MCGICGIYRRDGDRAGIGEDEDAVRRMVALLERRGPDDQGVHNEGPVTLGNRRLAILDLSPAGHQPMESPGGRYVVTFNGEIYNHREVAAELGLGSGELRSRSDTEVLLRAWERWSTDALPRLVGQWAFAMYDRQTHDLWLCRDRFGEKPLYYHEGGGALAFASSIPALLGTPWVPRELDPAGVCEYLTLRFVVAPRTVVTGIAKVPPGHWLRIGPAGRELRRWYAPRFHRGPRRRRAALIEEFDALFERAVSRCLVSDVPVALFLSDGIDSNGIHHVLRAAGDTAGSADAAEIPALTFVPVPHGGGPTLGRPLASGATPVFVPADERVESMLGAFASLTEPVGDGAALATWLLVRGARERATVFLCGHGGDEVLGGYRLNYDRFRIGLLRALSWLPADWVREQTERYLHGDEPFAARWRRVRSAPCGRIPDAARYLTQRPLEPAELRALRDGAGLPEPYLAIVDRLYAESDGRTALDRVQEVLLHTFLSAGILSWADAVAMDASAELRMPYLDRDLVDFVLGLPPDLRASPWPGRARTKQVLRRWGRGRLDEAVLRRGKHGFPFGNLPELFATDGPVLRARILDPAPVRRLLPGLKAWLDGTPERFGDPREGTLWALLALGIWCEAAGIR